MSTVKSKKLQVGTDASASNNFTIYQPSTPDGTLRIGVGNADSPTEVGRFDGSGNLTPTNGIYLGGTTSDNLLDDYEEGTWTPVDASGVGLSITVNNATYTKIGNTVHLRCYVTYPSTGNTSAASLSGLPFARATNGWVCTIVTTGKSGTEAVARINGTDLIYFKYISNGNSSIPNSLFSAEFIIFAVSYQSIT